MKTRLDIGIDINGFLTVFIPRQTEAPFEVSNHMKLSNLEDNNMILQIYEGVCIQNELNHCLKVIQLENVREGVFLLQMKLMERDGKLILRVMSDDIILTDLDISVNPELWLGKACKEDDDKREWYNAREAFIEFVDNAYEFLNDLDVKPHIEALVKTDEDRKYFQSLKDQLNDAIKVIECCDASKDEYNLMLDEISECINPFIAQIQMIVKRERI